MQDRVPLYPGRVKLTPVAGHENVYDMVRQDQPTQEGTPLNKNSLLKDATAELFQLGTDAVPDDVLKILSKSALIDKDGGLSSTSGSKIKQIHYDMVQYYGTGDFNVTFTVNHKPIFGVILAPTSAYVPHITGIFIPDSVYASDYYWIVISADRDSSPNGYEMNLNRTNGTMSFTSGSSGANAMYDLNRSGTKYLVFYLWEEDL